MLRPWLAAVALIACALAALIVFAWSVNFRAPEVVAGLAEVAARGRLEGLAMGLHLEAAEMRRDEVRRLRDENAPALQRRAARFALADQLRDAALLAEVAGDLDAAGEWMAEASQAAPERTDLICSLTDLRTRDAPPVERRMELLRLVHRYENSACANLLAGESFAADGDAEAARAYLARATESAPRWPQPQMALARLQLNAGDVRGAREHAAEALANSEGLRSRLEAADLLRRAGGEAPARWRIVAEWAWRRYAWLLPMAAAFVVLLISPALVGWSRRGVARARAQCGISDSAS